MNEPKGKKLNHLKKRLNKILDFELNKFYLLVFTDIENLHILDTFMTHINLENPKIKYDRDMNGEYRDSLEKNVLSVLVTDFNEQYNILMQSEENFENNKKFILDVLDISNNKFKSSKIENKLLEFHTMKCREVKSYFDYKSLYESFEQKEEIERGDNYDSFIM